MAMDDETISPARPRLRAGMVDLTVVAASLFFFPVLLQSLLFLVGVSLTPASFAIGLLIGAAAPLFICTRDRSLILAYGIVIVALALAAPLLTLTWDNTGDSLNYHQPAIIEMAAGANPVYDDLSVIWSEHYPHAAWVFSAGVYSLTGVLGLARLLHVLSALAAFGAAAFAFLRFTRVRPWISYTLAVVVALNPVLLYQVATHMLDGEIAGLGVCLLMLAIDFSREGGSHKREVVATGIMVAVLVANLKFTGLVFVATLIAFVWASALIRRSEPSPARTKSATLMLVALACGILILGFSPYVENTIEHKNPLYPMFSGVPGTDVSAHRPPDSREKSAPVAFVMSLLDHTSGWENQGPFQVKNPFSVTRAEVDASAGGSPLRGGFGPLFLLALSGSAVLAVLYLADSRRMDYSLRPRRLAAILIVVTALTLLMVEAWLARVAPLFYIVPALVALAAFTGEKGSSRTVRALAFAVIVVLVANIAIVSYANARLYRSQIVQRNEVLAALDSRHVSEMAMNPGFNFEEGAKESLRTRIKDLGVLPPEHMIEGTAFTVALPAADGPSPEGMWEDYPGLWVLLRFE